MTDTFDYDDLVAEVSLRRMAISPAAAAAYLRTRIEAAFVPVEDVTAERGRMVDRIEEWERQIAEATARAEAAEAENAKLREALSQIRALTTQHRTHVTRAVYRIASEALGDEHGK